MLQIAADNAHIPNADQFTFWVNQLSQFIEINENMVSVRVVEPDESQALNLQFRGIDKATNVLSFPAAIPAAIAKSLAVSMAEHGQEPYQERYLGDIIICADIVQAEAQEQNKPIEAHWAHLLVHGALHLHGYDHIKTDEAEKMESLEIKILSTMAYANPYQDDAAQAPS